MMLDFFRNQDRKHSIINKSISPVKNKKSAEAMAEMERNSGGRHDLPTRGQHPRSWLGLNPGFLVQVWVCMRAQLPQLCLTLCDPMDCSPPGSSVHGDSSGKNTGLGYHCLFQGICLTPGSHPHCRQSLLLRHVGSPGALG